MSWRHGLTPSLAWAAGSTASRRSSGAKPAGRLAKLMQEGYTATATVEPDAPFVVCRSFRTPPFSQKRSEQEQRINVGARGQVLYMEDSDAIVQIGDEVLRVKPHGFSNLRVTRGLSHVVKEDLLKEVRKLVHQLTDALDACQKAITCLSEAGPPASRTGYLKPLEDILPRPHEGWQEDELPNMVKEYYPTNLQKRADYDRARYVEREKKAIQEILHHNSMCRGMPRTSPSSPRTSTRRAWLVRCEREIHAMLERRMR